MSITGCTAKDIFNFVKTANESDTTDGGIVGYTNNGAVNTRKMTELEFERIHYGAAVIQDEDKFLFSGNANAYDFPELITTEEDWELLQEKLNIDMEDIDFDEYVVYGVYEHDLWDITRCHPVLIEQMAYNDQTFYYGWLSSTGIHFEAENKEDRLCGFDIVKIKRSDFPMESRDVFGSIIDVKTDEEDDFEVIMVESGGYYLVY